MRTRNLAFLALALISAAAACEPGTPMPVWPAPAASSQAPEGTLVVGDSITWQANLSGYLPQDGAEYHVGMGWRLDETIARIRERRDAGTLGTLVIALGTNDADPTWNGGWDQADEQRWVDAVNQLAPETEVSVVLPWVCDRASAALIAEINEARAFMTLLADVFDLRLVDWQDYATEPGVMGSDCVHLAVPEGGNAAFDVEPVAGTARAAVIAAARSIEG